MAMPTDPMPATRPVPQSTTASSDPLNRPDGMIEIALPGGVSVRVDAQVDSGALRRVLAVLARR
jgi:transposase